MAEEKHTHDLEDIPGLKILFASRAAAEHKHVAAEIVDALTELGLYPVKKESINSISDVVRQLALKVDRPTVDELRNALRKKSDAQHRHNYNEIDGIAVILDQKANRTDVTGKADKTEVAELRHVVGSKVGKDHLDPIFGQLRSKVERTELESFSKTDHRHEIGQIEGLERTLKELASIDVNRILGAVNDKASRTHRHSHKDISDLPALLEVIEKHRYPVFKVQLTKDKILRVTFETTNGYYTPSLRIKGIYDRVDNVFVQLDEKKFIDGVMVYDFDLSSLSVNVLFRFQVKLSDVNNPRLLISSEFLECRF